MTAATAGEPDEDATVIWGVFDDAVTHGRGGYTIPPDVVHWRAIDAPFAQLDEWAATLETGTCTGCGQPGHRGDRRWWHIDGPGCWDVEPRRDSRFRGE